MTADVTFPSSITSNTGAFPLTDFRLTAGSMPYLTQRYALPIHHASLRKDSSDGSLDSGERTPRAENTLRRKTPNGTLNAGYDGSVDYATPPLKHQLLPLSEGNSTRPVHASVPHLKRTFVQHQHHQRQTSGLGTWNGQVLSGWQGNQFGQPQTSIPVMDSMLNQGLPAQQWNVQQYYGQTVPSVIQPSFTYLGPTASGGQGSGPYGPYWHDGTFVPYRPAAIRDPRFYHHPTNLVGSLPSSHLAHQAQLWQQPTPTPNPWTPIQGVGPYTPPPFNFPIGLQQPPFGPAYRHGSARPNDSRFHPSVRGPVAPYQHASGLHQDGLTVEDEFGSTSPNGRQRDKTFSWALQQYRELLGFIHHTRRQQQQNRHAHGQQQVPPRPSFYPKPPKQSASGSSIQLAKSKTDSDLTQGNHDEDPPIADSQAEGGPEPLSSVDSTPKQSSTSVWSPSGVHFNDNEYQRRASHEQYRRPHESTFAIPPSLENQRTLRRSTGSSVAAIVPPLPMDDSPPSRAATALSYMTKLCQDTDWQWIDGMHLGGCLAYGLGNYQKAHRWYTKVLERDPKHLEATSNLAATLLALGQRREAEQHWMQVVKAAPNHFEAVEHLVGVLCHDHRSKDAIKVIEYVERSLRQAKSPDTRKASDRQSECSSSTASKSPCVSEQSDKISYDFDTDGDGFNMDWRDAAGPSEPGFGSSGFAIPGCDNGRILALIHAKGNMLYGLGDNGGAARAFEDAVLIAAGRHLGGIQGLVKHILTVVSSNVQLRQTQQRAAPSGEPVLLSPEQALATSKLCFPDYGELPGLRYITGGPHSLGRKAVISTTSNSLLSLAKIFQDGMSNANRSAGVPPLAHGVRDILALYYLSLSLQPSPSTANNVGILLASVQQAAPPTTVPQKPDIPGVTPGSGIALALQYYNYGLQLDSHHAHLYTNLGSLLKDIGQLDAAINMYERAVRCDGKFDIALANLANAVKDKGRISDAIVYYKRAVEVSPEFAEAVCGLANALNSVCSWQARGGIAADGGKRDRWHVAPSGMLLDASLPGATSSGWIKRVVDIVEKQLREGEDWGRGAITFALQEDLVQQVLALDGRHESSKERGQGLQKSLVEWAGHKWEGARITRLVERLTRCIGWHWYRDTYVKKRQRTPSSYNRPRLPTTLTVPTAPTVLPFHTFTSLSADHELESRKTGASLWIC